MRTIRLALLEGDPVIIEGKSMLFNSNPRILVVYQQDNADLAIAELPEQLVDVIVLDQRLKGKDGVATAAELAAAYQVSGQGVPAMILTTPYRSEQLVTAAAESGISQVLAIEDGPNALLDAIERLAF